MTVATLRLLNHEAYAEKPADARLARVEVFDDFSAVEPHWRALEDKSLLATPYQSYDFMSLWHRHIGAAAGLTPFLAVGFNAAGEPLFLWPLGKKRLGGLRVVAFLGGKHTNFNMALWRRDVAAGIGAAELRSALDALSAQADIVRLINQPLTWAGSTNPFALLPHQRSANFGFSGKLAPDFEALLRARTNAAARKKMRKKERALAEYGTVRFARAETAQEIRAVLDAFFKQKAARMRMQGLPDAYADAGVRRFVEAAAALPVADGGALLELFSLSVDDVIVATMGGISGDGRFCAMFNSFLPGRFAVESPGEQLIVNLVRQCCAKGFHTFDLGIGEAHYKGLFCGDVEPLFDSYWPLTPSGRRVAIAFRFAAAAKRAIKQHPALWSMVTAARRLRGRLSNKRAALS